MGSFTTSASSLEALAWRVVSWALPAAACERPASLWDIPADVLSSRECLRAVVSRVLGLGIVVGAGLIKLPQIYAIVASGSVAGLSTASFAVDTFGYTYNLAAHVRQKYPLSTYGDFAVLLLQNYLLLYMCFAYSRRAARGAATLAAFVALLAFLCADACPLELVQALTLLNIPVVVVGRLPQIYANYANQSTGSLSALTSWGVFLGATARIFTTLQDVDSNNILLGYVASAFFNGVIAVQVLLYARRKPSRPSADPKKNA